VEGGTKNPGRRTKGWDSQLTVIKTPVPTAARKTHTHTAVLKKLVHTTYRFSKNLKRFNEK